MNKIDKLIQYINESNNIVFFGGAGVSTESGIPDFRSKDGLYNQHDVKFDMYNPEYLLSRDCLYNNPKVFYELLYKQSLLSKYSGLYMEYDENYIFDSDEAIPKCPHCRKLIRPNVVLYGESLPNKVVNYSIDALHKADMLIIGGTSLQVYPAANFIYEFRGKHMVVINKEELKVQLNDKTDLVFTDSLGNVFREIDERLNYDFKK